MSSSFAARQWVVVLDAGHGGKDPGTVNGRNYEKSINLAVAQATGRLLKERNDIKIVYTRTDDKFVELVERSNIAAKVDADLFVSIHTNASPNKKVSGTETYIMGVDKNNANLSVSMRENGVISLESNYTQTYEGYDPNSVESLIMFSLMQYSFSRESLELASILQKEYAATKRRNNGVKQAGFLVLWRNAMPSILTELGYLSNEAESRYLLSKEGQKELCQALATSIINYIEQSAQADDPTPAVTPPPTRVNTPKIATNGNAHFAVQLRSANTQIEINSRSFGPYVMKVVEHKLGNLYKYVVGKLFFYKDALLLQDKIRQIYPDAFIVAFDDNGNQISVSQGKDLIEQ